MTGSAVILRADEPWPEKPAHAGPGYAVTIGNFDGVHRGHRHLLGQVRAEATARGLKTAVLTFWPHPSAVLGGRTAPPLLTTKADKLQWLAHAGADWVVERPFDLAIAGLTPDAFIQDYLITRLRARAVCVGHDFVFGHKRSGNVASLERAGAHGGFAVHQVDALAENGAAISSSAVRDALEAGDTDRAAALLGRLHYVAGEIVAGDRRGHAIGFPTANLRPGQAMLPADGVYATWAGLEGGEILPAVTNIGVRPTFGGGARGAETHILNFSGSIYGQKLVIYFAQRLRGEKRFNGIAELTAQIRADVAHAAAELHESRRPAPLPFVPEF